MLSWLEKKKRKFFLDSFWKKNWTCGDDNNSHDLFWNWLFLFSADSTFMLSFTNAPIRVARRYYYRQQPARSIHPIRLLCVCKLIHDKECVYIYRAFWISRTPFITGLATAPLSFSIRKESGTTKLNAIPYFCFVFFFLRKKNGGRDENDEGELFYGLAPLWIGSSSSLPPAWKWNTKKKKSGNANLFTAVTTLTLNNEPCFCFFIICLIELRDYGERTKGEMKTKQSRIQGTLVFFSLFSYNDAADSPFTASSLSLLCWPIDALNGSTCSCCCLT